MMLETGGPDVNFAPKPLAGVNGTAVHPPEQLLLDGQQRLTSLYQSLKSQRPVDTLDPRGKKLRRWYLIDIQGALGDEGDREEAIISAPEDLKVRDDFGRQVRADYSTIQQQCAAGAFPLRSTPVACRSMCSNSSPPRSPQTRPTGTSGSTMTGAPATPA